MARREIDDADVDIVICALHPDLRSFMESWRQVFARFHIIVVKDPDLDADLLVPEGFDLDTYDKSDILRVAGPSFSPFLSGYAARYFGYLVSRRRYVVSFDEDCVPPTVSPDPVSQHLINLSSPATPLFFNTLYDPFRPGSDFVRGYPFGMRAGVPCALSSGLWLNAADYDSPTRALKLDERSSRVVDAVVTVPSGALVPLGGTNVAFDRELLGPAVFSGLRLAGEGKVRRETIEDVWCGMCVKAVCDSLGFGVKTGLPYVFRDESGDVVDSLRKEWEGVKLMEHVVLFFDQLRLPENATTVEDSVVQLAFSVKEKLGSTNSLFSRAADAMLAWVLLWNNVTTHI